MSVLKSVKEDGRTVIVVTHDPAVAKMCDRVLTIQDGLFIQ
ncbi:MAG: hypothetical protein ACOX88_03305 [Christensenellales bacterium]|jgi:ABC-type lipoprotein export system ATPase subunit